MLDRTAGVIAADRKLAGVSDDEIGDALTEPWGKAKPVTWNRNRAAVGSWLVWCAGKQHWVARRCRVRRSGNAENNDDTKAGAGCVVAPFGLGEPA